MGPVSYQVLFAEGHVKGKDPCPCMVRGGYVIGLDHFWARA